MHPDIHGRTFLIILYVLVIHPAGCESQVQCPVEEGSWEAANKDECFALRQPSAWGTGCQSGKYASIQTLEELQAVKQLLMHEKDGMAWIGMARIDKQSHWGWYPFGRTSYTVDVDWSLLQWGEAAQNQHDCAAISNDAGSRNPVLVSVSCSVDLPTICRTDLFSAITENEQLTTHPRTIGFTYVDPQVSPEHEFLNNGYLHFNVPSRLPPYDHSSILTIQSGETLFSVRVIDAEGMPGFRINWGGTELVVSDIDISNKHFYVVVRTGSSIDMYIDGEHVGSAFDPDPFSEAHIVQSHSITVPTAEITHQLSQSVSSKGIRLMSAWRCLLFRPIDSSLLPQPKMTFVAYHVDATLTSCVATCIKNQGCRSISYVSSTKICLVHGDYITPGNGLVLLSNVGDLPATSWVHRSYRVPNTWWIDTSNPTLYCSDLLLSNLSATKCEESSARVDLSSQCFCTTPSACRCAVSSNSWMYSCPSIISPVNNGWVPIPSCDTSDMWFLIPVPQSYKTVVSLDIEAAGDEESLPTSYKIYVCKPIYGRMVTGVTGTRCVYVSICEGGNGTVTCAVDAVVVHYIKVSPVLASPGATPVIRSVVIGYVNESALNDSSESSNPPIDDVEVIFEPTSDGIKILASILGSLLSAMLILGNGAHAWKTNTCKPGAIRKEECPAIPQQSTFVRGASTATRVALPNSMGEDRVTRGSTHFSSLAPPDGRDSLMACRPKEPALQCATTSCKPAERQSTPPTATEGIIVQSDTAAPEVVVAPATSEAVPGDEPARED